MRHWAHVVLGLLGLLAVTLAAQAQTTPFTYQGRVSVNGTAFTGAGQFKFALMTAVNASRQAAASATVSGGFLTIVSVTDGGAGYVSAPAVTVIGGGGSGAVLTAQVSGGAITNIIVNNPGSGYASTPTISIGAPPDSFAYTTFWSNDGTSFNGSEPSAAVSVSVANGIFTVELGDPTVANMQAIASSVFNTANLQLRIWFNGGGGFSALSPLQRLTYAPYAATSVYAANAGTALTATSAGSLTGTITGANIPTGLITSDKFAPGAVATNLQANGQSGVASGGVILSASENAALVTAGYVKIGSTQLGDRWQLRAAGGSVPDGRLLHSTVWTGTEMIIWGGFNENGLQNTGGRYNPTNDTWTSVSTTNAPAPRTLHTAVWTGTEMIVWGGWDEVMTFFDTGGRYNPATNTWTSGGTSTTNVASARGSHSVVWTGTEMIVWGGGDGMTLLNTGGRYNPNTDTWAAGGTSVTNVPVARYDHTAIWTGTEVIVWGGYNGSYEATGGRYNPANNTWTAGGTTMIGVPTGRTMHTAVWTGAEMIVWGGSGAMNTRFNHGGRYNPSSNTWSNGGVTTVNAPQARRSQAAVWTGGEMIIWGGSGPSSFLNDGGRYNPFANTWSTVTLNGAATARQLPSTVWTGNEMIIWGGFSFSTFNETWSYDPGKVMYLYQKP